MCRRPARSTRTDTLVPYSTLCRAQSRASQRPAALRGPSQRPAAELPAAVDGAVELASARVHGDRERGRRVRLPVLRRALRSEEHTSELQSLMRISYAVFCLKKKKRKKRTYTHHYENTQRHQTTRL